MVDQPESNIIETVERLLKLPYGRIILPESDGSFRGEIVEFPGCIATGDTAAETFAALEKVAKSWLLSTIERGQPVPHPIDNNTGFSGRLVLRLPKSLHKKAAWYAEREGVSLNQFITTSLSESVGERSKPGNIFISSSSVMHISNYSVSYISGSISSIRQITSYGSTVHAGTTAVQNIALGASGTYVSPVAQIP
jgi:antitoxin HicB